jgi:hypothetical protein
VRGELIRNVQREQSVHEAHVDDGFEGVHFDRGIQRGTRFR